MEALELKGWGNANYFVFATPLKSLSETLYKNIYDMS
jgi:hypothetical protein